MGDAADGVMDGKKGSSQIRCDGGMMIPHKRTAATSLGAAMTAFMNYANDPV
jgi:hypothetical protein